jgi:hypothetical protein
MSTHDKIVKMYCLVINLDKDFWVKKTSLMCTPRPPGKDLQPRQINPVVEHGFERYKKLMNQFQDNYPQLLSSNLNLIQVCLIFN